MIEENGQPKVYGVVQDLRSFRPDDVPPRSRKYFSAAPACIGLAILIGGQNRFHNLVTPGHLAPWWAWSIAFILCTVVMIPYAYQHSMHYFWPAMANSILFLFFALCLAWQSRLSDFGSFTGVAFYGWYAVCLAAVAARDEHKLWPFRR